MKKIILFCLNIILACLLISCGSAKNYATSQSAPSYGRTEMNAYEYTAYDGAAPASEGYYESEIAVAEMDEGNARGESVQERKIITSCNILMESNSFDDVFQQMKDIAIESGGYVQNADSYIKGYSSNGKELKGGSLVLRIPSDAYKDAKTSIEGLGKVTTVNESTLDETNSYYDINARLTRKQLEEERLLAMIEEARAVKDLIELESRLAEVRTEIEIYQASMRNIDRLVSYSTITISLTEKADAELTYASDDLGSRIKNSFINSFNGTITFLQNIIIFLASVIVPVGIIGIICAVIYFIWRFKRTK